MSTNKMGCSFMQAVTYLSEVCHTQACYPSVDMKEYSFLTVDMEARTLEFGDGGGGQRLQNIKLTMLIFQERGVGSRDKRGFPQLHGGHEWIHINLPFF